jgi:hypothetical protein
VSDYAALERLLLSLINRQGHASLSVHFNECAASYMSAEEYEERNGIHEDEWVSTDERRRAFETNSVWEIQWYPETPVGFYVLKASSLNALLAAIEKKQKGKP